MTFDYEFDYGNPPSRLQMLMDVRVYIAAAWRVAVVAIGCYYTYLPAHLIEFPLGFNPAGLWAFVNMAATAVAAIVTLVLVWNFILAPATRGWDLFWYFARDADKARERREKLTGKRVW